MRMPPNIRGLIVGALVGSVAASMRGGMRMPPNVSVSAQERLGRTPRFNEGRHAHAAE